MRAIDRNNGAKFCQVALRGNEQAAHEIEDGIIGEHTLSQIAYNINQHEAAGNPETLRYEIQLNGEGSWVLHVLGNPVRYSKALRGGWDSMRRMSP